MEDFNKLNHAGQEKAVSGFGVLVSNHVDGYKVYDVYKLYSFYVFLTFELGVNTKSEVTTLPSYP